MENVENTLEQPKRKPLTPKAKMIITIVSIIAVLLVFILCIVIPYAVIMGNKLYVDNVDKIALGDVESKVIEVLGDPDSKDGDTWKYEGDNKYCHIVFEDGKVAYVVLNAAVKSESKTIAGTRFPGAENFKASDTSADLTYKVKYMDGSMLKGVTHAALSIKEMKGESLSDSDTYMQVATWEGAFGKVETDINRFEYDLVKDGNGSAVGVRITGFSGVNKEVIIPSTIAGLPVVGMGDNAMRELDIEKLFIPKTLTNMERWVIEKCDKLTVYCEAEKQPDSWSDVWNVSNVPVLWGSVRYESNGDVTLL